MLKVLIKKMEILLKILLTIEINTAANKNAPNNVTINLNRSCWPAPLNTPGSRYNAIISCHPNESGPKRTLDKMRNKTKVSPIKKKTHNNWLHCPSEIFPSNFRLKLFICCIGNKLSDVSSHVINNLQLSNLRTLFDRTNISFFNFYSITHNIYIKT